LSREIDDNNYNPRDIRIESSVDGTPGRFTTEESFTLAQADEGGVVPISVAFTSRYFKFHVVNSYNDSYVFFGELEIFQTQ
jgi:hypothetical protein